MMLIANLKATVVMLITKYYFSRFLEKLCPCGKIFKILFRKFTWPHRSTLLCSNVVKFIRREIGEIVRYLPDKKISAASQTVATCG